MSFVNCINQNQNLTLYDVTFRSVTADVILPAPTPLGEGLLYENSMGTVETITTSTNGDVLSVVGGVPTWVSLPPPVPSGNGVLVEKAGVVSAIPDGTATQILTTDGYNNPTWQNNPALLQQNLTIYCTFSQTNTGTPGSPITASTRISFNKLGTMCIMCITSFATTTNFTDASYYLVGNATFVPANWLPAFNTSPIAFPFMMARADSGLNVYGTMYINSSGSIIIEGNNSNGGLSMGGTTATSPIQYFSYIAASADA
jgi:hypothetical protein